MTFCTFCNHEVDPAMHIIPCTHCGGDAHEVEEHQYECTGCGWKFRQTIRLISAREEEEEIREDGEVPASEVRELEIDERAGKSTHRGERKSKGH